MRTLFMRPGQTDEIRGTRSFLTLHGRAQVRGVARRAKLELADLDIAAVLVADDPAAIQTAELASGVLDYIGLVRVMPELAAGTPAPTLLKPIMAAGDIVLVVAGEPFLSTLAAAIAGRPSFPTFALAELAMLEDRRPYGSFREGESMRPLFLA